MLSQQLRTFVFMAVALVRLSAGAHFDCNDAAGTIICQVTVSPGNSFGYSPGNQGGSCTEDRRYCAQVTGDTVNPGRSYWEIYVTNSGKQCYAECAVQPNSVCDNTGFCWDTCQANVC